MKICTLSFDINVYVIIQCKQFIVDRGMRRKFSSAIIGIFRLY